MTGLYDVHCHILPGVDDGAKDMKEALGMLKMQYESGVRTIFATPHYRRGMFETDSGILLERYQTLRSEAEKMGIRLLLGCEYHVDGEMVDKLKYGKKPTMSGSRYALSEFSTAVQQKEMKDSLYKLRMNGIRPIVAHIERYGAITKDLDFIESLVEMGVYIQINADSVLGREGFGAKRFCKKLLKEELVHFIGSDAHGIKERKPELGACAAYIEKKYGSSYVQRIFIDNPSKIIEKV
ncbi:MAG: capsular biosynthesis protein [Eubacteriales bacterium]|nr:capsular biosynthesis protein [Eubacteriales bacterium]